MVSTARSPLHCNIIIDIRHLQKCLVKFGRNKTVRKNINSYTNSTAHLNFPTSSSTKARSAKQKGFPASRERLRVQCIFAQHHAPRHSSALASPKKPRRARARNSSGKIAEIPGCLFTPFQSGSAAARIAASRGPTTI